MICDHNVIVELYNLFARGTFVDTKNWRQKSKELSGLIKKAI
jgi:hypothetical protein